MYCNANFDELDFRRATLFLDAYMKDSILSFEDISYLSKIAEYIAFFHWLKFTLESVQKGDNRILERIPDEIGLGLWWKNNSTVYANWIRNYFQ